MSFAQSMIRESKFLAQDRTVLAWMLVVLCLSTIAVWAGMAEVRHQQETIERILETDEQDRVAEFSKQGDWGSAAYYSFHVTYDGPSDFAFAALGQRDSMPWKHRIRMLALEGQIHEHDSGNPDLALIGRFDFSFFAAFVLPLVLIVLLHDLRAGERSAGRHDLLVVTAGDGRSLWRMRAWLRSLMIFVCALIPLLVAGVIDGAAFSTLLMATIVLFVYLLFWTVVCFWLGAWQRSAPVILAALVGVWVMLGVVIPASGRLLIDQAVTMPTGTEILMTQREAVNDAWDLPKEATMEPFLERYPEWSNTAPIEGSWHWKWYYAFQQVGDQRAEDLSTAYTGGRRARDRLAAMLSLLAPPALIERSFQHLAETDLDAVISYENRVREFHSDLRTFYYPGLFGDKPFDVSAIEELPDFRGGTTESR